MIPIPQYPLYTACLSANNARPVPYYLKEEQDWATSLDDMRSSLQEARDKNQYDVRAVSFFSTRRFSQRFL